jgi:hypothetical protein
LTGVVVIYKKKTATYTRGTMFTTLTGRHDPLADDGSIMLAQAVE